MSTAMSELDFCGCCSADESTPAIYNRPGLAALAYRSGTHPTVLQRMLKRLATQKVEQGGRPLAQLNARAGDDPAIALLDAWATLADVLTFYQERIANEGYLRTATEQRSIVELVRTISYELSPGVAASTFLAFTVEDAVGAPGVATVPLGTKVKSIPAQGQRPQTFETSEEIQARAEWNALKPRLTEPYAVDTGTCELYLKGITTQIQPGDGILLVGDERDKEDTGSERWDFRILQTVTPYSGQDYTLVSWKEGLGSVKVKPAEKNLRVFAFRQRASLFGYNAPDFRGMADSVKKAYYPTFDFSQPQSKWPTEWPNFSIQTIAQKIIDLDTAYPKIVESSWLVLKTTSYVELYKAQSVSIDSRTDFTLSSKTTRVVLDTNEHLNRFGLRTTTVYAQSEPLELAEKPKSEPVYGNTIVLDRLVSSLIKDQTLIVSGKRGRVIIKDNKDNAQGLTLKSADGKREVILKPGDRLQVIVHSDDDQSKWTLMDRDGFVGVVTAGANQLTLQSSDKDDATVYEVAFIKVLPPPDRDHTTLTLRDPLANYYDRTTVTINANVARATHGETVQNEVLGNGNGAQPNQRFTLQKPPLTYVSAPTASGGATTLELRVNDLLWQEVPSLYRLQADSRAYSVRLTAEGKPQVIFGDGEQGARLPTGVENVRATYRSGIGLEGMVAANQLTLLQTRPLGIRSVTNPLAATGAADRENMESARRNAPLKVLTLDRIVSLQDYADFARNFAGIGKAKAVAMWSGEERLVHLTVAAGTGKEIDKTSDLYKSLVKAIDTYRDPGQRFEVVSFEIFPFSLTAHVLVDQPRYIRAKVLAQVIDSLLQAFAFEQREFGQPVTAAEVIAVIQQASQGVLAVRLDEKPPLWSLKNDKTGETGTILLAPIASKPDEKTGLLRINPDGIKLEEWNA